MLGVGGRALGGAAITNATGKPVTVHITATSSQHPGLNIYINGALMIGGNNINLPTGSVGGISYTFIVPTGANYNITTISDSGILIWSELR